MATDSVAAGASAPTISLGDEGLIIGHLFSRSNLCRRVFTIDPEDKMRILRSSGELLLKEFWGGYIALIATAEGAMTVIRDPSGIMPCYWRVVDGQIFLSNDISSIAELRPSAKVDAAAIVQFLAYAHYSGEKTGLQGIAELPPGHALDISDGSVAVRNCWSPWSFARAAGTLTFSEAAEQANDVIQKCVGAWAACFDNVILGVSGGLDSSIVAAASAPHTDLRCLTMYADDPEGDERHYAQILADALALPLHTKKLSLNDIDISQPVLPNRPWPNASHFAQCTRSQHMAMQEARPAGAYFTGNGGDNIFCSLRSTSPFLDRLFEEGPGFGLKQTLGDLCELTETDAAAVLKTAWNQYVALRKPRPTRCDTDGLAPEKIIKRVVQHPWLSRQEECAPGKAAHIALLARAQQSHDLYSPSSNAPHIAPLLSQPIVELCLSIPTWFWVHGGKNRAVARRAFESILPEMIIRRTSKGGPEGFAQSIYSENSEKIKTMLRDGFLARGGYLDRSYLDGPDDPTWRGRKKTQRLLFLLGAETWCRHWDSGQ